MAVAVDVQSLFEFGDCLQMEGIQVNLRHKYKAVVEGCTRFVLEKNLHR